MKITFSFLLCRGKDSKLHPLSIKHFVLDLVLYHWCLFHFDLTVTVLTNDDLALLEEKLANEAHQWYTIGIQLGFDPGNLKGIESYVRGDVKRGLEELLTQWLHRAEPPSTLQSIIDVVGGKVIQNQVLAERLKRECGDFPSIRNKTTCKFSMYVLS